MCSRVAVSTPRRAVRHAPAGLAGEHRQAQADRAAVVAGPQRFVLVLPPPAGGVVPGSQTVFEACSAGRAVAWLVASSAAGGTDHAYLLFLGCSAYNASQSVFLQLIMWHSSSRAVFWLQCLRGACFFLCNRCSLQRFFCSSTFAAMSGAC